MSTTTSQQFEGTTVEEALAAAVDALGDDLEIIDAQRVRRRKMLGVRRREIFEVTASKRDLAEPKDFNDVLKRMVERVDEAERDVESDLAASDRRWLRQAEFVIPDQPAHAAPSSEPAPAELDIELDVRDQPAISVAASPSMSREARALVGDAFISVQHETQAPAPRTATALLEPTPMVREDTPIWSAEALLALDLPRALVGRIPTASLDTDLDWVAALEKAIADLLETAQCMSGPCELSGHGAEASVHLIRGACDGFRLDSLIIDGRRVPATALELALAIRSLLREQA